MRSASPILAALHDWLQGAGYRSVLNMSPRVGRACYGGTPNITLPDHDLFLQVNDGNILVCDRYAGRKLTMDMADPEMVDKLVKLLSKEQG